MKKRLFIRWLLAFKISKTTEVVGGNKSTLERANFQKILITYFLKSSGLEKFLFRNSKAEVP